MPTGPERIAAFLHPAMALLSVLFLFFVASLGLRCRERGGEALRPRHARLAPVAYGLMVANVVFGIASVWLLRPDLELASGAHFRIGVAIAAVLTIAALVSTRIATDERARRLHPLLGLLALLLAALQVFFGLPLLPL